MNEVLSAKGLEKLLKTPIAERPNNWQQMVLNYYNRVVRGEEEAEPVPLLEEQRQEIHPAQDFTENMAFTTQYLYYNMDNGEELIPTLITSNRQLFLLTKDRENRLLEAGIRISYRPYNLKNRWSNQALDYFLKNPDNQIDLNFVFEQIQEQLRYYFDWSNEVLYDFFAVWFIGTYFHQLFSSFPYIQLFGVKASGKSKLLYLGSLISFNGWYLTGITPAVLFRIVQDNRCSLLIDEADYDKKDLAELRGLLTGYKKGVLVPRISEKKAKGIVKRQIDFFEVYSPKMLAGIYGLDDVLGDRCITITTERANVHNKEGRIKANRFPKDEDKVWQSIRDNCYLALMEKFKDIRLSYETLKSVIDQYYKTSSSTTSTTTTVKGGIHPFFEIGGSIAFDGQSGQSGSLTETFRKISENVDSRNLELWLPLYSVAYAIRLDIFEKLVDFSIKTINEKKTVENMEGRDTLLFEFLLKKIQIKEMYAISDIRKSLEDELGEQNWLTVSWLGRALRRLGIVIEAGRIGIKRAVYLDPEVIKDKALRYGVDVEEILAEAKKQEEIEKQETLADSLDVKKDEDELEGEEFLSG